MFMEKENFVKTTIPLILGVIAGFLSFIVADGIRSRDPIGIVILVFSIYVNKFLMPKMGVKLESKDWFGISIMCFAGWYITWTFLLNL